MDGEANTSRGRARMVAKEGAGAFSAGTRPTRTGTHACERIESAGALLRCLVAIVLMSELAEGRAGGRSFNGMQTRRPKAHATIVNSILNDKARMLRDYVDKTWDEQLYNKEKSVVDDEGDLARLLMTRLDIGEAERGSKIFIEGELVHGERKPQVPSELANLPIPKRPAWKAGSTDKKELDRLEQEEFIRWRKELHGIEDVYDVTVTPYEKNPEFWRQLWRVVERSHVIVQVVDCRNPLLYRATRLEEYVDETRSGQVKQVLLLNKADLVPRHVRKDWAKHLSQQDSFKVFFFTCAAEEDGGDAEGEEQHDEDDEDEQGLGGILSREELLDELLKLGRTVQRDAGQRVQIGFVGYPNVGKSSAVNSLLGEKKVAQSRSAGRTKHLQTHLVGPDLCLCDSPGIVFPSIIKSTAEMVCGGMLNVHNLRDAFGPAAYICQAVPRAVMEAFYKTKITSTGPDAPSVDPKDLMRAARMRRLVVGGGHSGKAVAHGKQEEPYTAKDLLEALCRQRKFFQQRSGLPDVHRAAMLVVQDFVRGRLPSWHLPPEEGEAREEDDVLHNWSGLGLT